MNPPRKTGLLRSSAWGVAGLLAACLVAGLLRAVHAWTGGTSGKLALYGVIAGLLVLPMAIFLGKKRKSARPNEALLVGFATASSLLVSVYLFGVSFYLLYPADFLMWSETDFINDILKFRVGYPIFSADANNESYTYTPASQLITYMLAWITGQGTSLPAMRFIQLGYTTLAVAIAMHVYRRLVGLSAGDADRVDTWDTSPAGQIALFGALFLVATNSLTIPFIHNLHNDALAQLLSIAGYALLVEYAATRERNVLIAMLFIPALGFLVKQNLALWGGFYCIYLLVLDRPRSFRTLVVFSGAAFALLCATIFACYLVWGEHFTYWVFYVLSEHHSVPARSIQHFVDTRGYFALAFAGAALLLRGNNFPRLFGLFCVWLLIMLLAIYTGGINFMRHHMGPASLIAGVWFVAGVVRTFGRSVSEANSGPGIESWVRALFIAALAGLLASSSLGIVRSPKPPLNEDAYRYLAAIDQEFEGYEADQVLLDLGSYRYLETGTVMRDRASPIGERGSTDTGDLSGVVERFGSQHYKKLLLRNYGSDNFWYDHPTWPKSSGIQSLLEQSYREVGRIPAVAHPQSLWARHPPYGFAEITILVPRDDAAR